MRALREQILRGEYAAGERLPAERELAQRLGVNRSSVREALRKLEQLGLVSIRHGGGATVRQLHEASVDIVPHLVRLDERPNLGLVVQIADVHEMLVAGAARLAVERGGDEDLQRARDLLKRLADPATRDENFPAIVDLLFGVVTDASGNLVLRLCRNTLGPAMNLRLGGFFWRVLRASGPVFEALVKEIDTAIVERNPARAEEAVRGLLREGRRRLLAELEPGTSERPPGAEPPN
ncbi:MAG: GntR family transcriptional regulator [Proteobacteria bacterium]|nr:GntR family transcriptional regulator [Pseudomonadota bacterium]